MQTCQMLSISLLQILAVKMRVITMPPARKIKSRQDVETMEEVINKLVQVQTSMYRYVL